MNTTKTPAGMRQVPMLEFVKEAFLMEKERQELLGLHCEATVDGYTDFVFVNRFLISAISFLFICTSLNRQTPEIVFFHCTTSGRKKGKKDF